MSARMFKLTHIHQRIDERIRLEMRRVRPDWLELSRLKRMKLRVKDALHRLTARRAET